MKYQKINIEQDLIQSEFNQYSIEDREKAIIAATFAAPLLQSTQRQGEGLLTGTLRAVGEGTSKLPTTLIALEKAQ